MKRAIFGYGGHAREVAAQMGGEVDFFVDDEYASGMARPISKFNINEYEMLIAIGDSEERFRAFKKLNPGTKFFTFIHPTALIMGDDVQIGEGSFIGAYSIITANVKLGNHSLLNRGNHIGHDSEIGDFFSAMPGAIVSGNVKIGDKSYMGTNSSIKEKITLVGSIKLGMNSCIVKDCLEEGTYAGCPAKKIEKNSDFI